MAVRITERTIPGGFDNASDLGQVDISADKNYALVSYLSQPLRQGRIEDYAKHITNTYVVFVNTKNVAEPSEYDWKVEFFSNEAQPFSPPSEKTEIGIYELNSEKYPELQGKKISSLIVTVTISGVQNPLILPQEVTGLAEDIEELIAESGDDNIALGGNPDTTRLIANDYRDYFKKEGSIPINLVAAVTYLHLLDTSYDERLENLQAWEEYLEKYIGAESPPNALKTMPLGVAYIRPQLLAMMLGKLGNIQIWDEDQDSKSKYEEAVFESFHKNVSESDKIDIFNLLRFPKSSLKQCGILLEKLLKRGGRKEHPDWKDLRSDDLIDNEECVQTIVSEYKRGPSKTLKNLSEVGQRAFDMMFTPFIEAIAIDLIPYQIIKIKVLDIRSGRPIPNAKVRKLFIRGSGTTGIGVNNEGEFKYDLDRITESGNQLLKGAQRALIRLGYIATNNEDVWCNNNIKWNQITSNAYNSYWSHRVLDNSITSDAKKQPDDYYLRRIVDEYNSHAYTTDEGIVEAKIPRAFLNNRKISIDVGFWEFPIALEELSNDKRGNPISRPEQAAATPSEAQTDFEISWIGDTPNNFQEAEWNGYVDNTGNFRGDVHFGWKVQRGGNESNLKVWQRLVVKDDTDEFKELVVGLLSKYYRQTKIHFVLFGMQWCQPVWAPIPGTATHRIRGKVSPQNGTSANTFEPIPANARNSPIMVSLKSGSGTGKGRDYGMLVSDQVNAVDENNNSIANPQNNPDPAVVTIATYVAPNVSPRNNNHDGIDYYGIEQDSPVFVPHGGIVPINGVRGTPTAISTSSGYGITRIIRFEDYYIRLAHLYGEHSRSNANPDNSLLGIQVGDIVMAGLKIGFAGRTFYEHNSINAANGRYYKSGATHLHLEICRNGTARRIANPLSIFNNFPDEQNNIIVFLNNDSYRLFPCDCHWPTGSQHTAQNCAIRIQINPDPSVSSQCWASRNLHCPYLAVNQNQVFKIQAQLTYLFSTDPNFQNAFEDNIINQNNPDFTLPYRNPGGITGLWNAGSAQAIRRFRMRHREYIFQNLPANPSENQISNSNPFNTGPGDPDYDELNVRTLARLNLVAPYPRTPDSLARVET